MSGGPAEENRWILARVASGEREALEKLYSRFGGSLFRYLLTLSPDRRLAEEILQDTMVAAWHGAHTYGGRSSVRAWLFGIARRQAHNTLRRRALPLDESGEPDTLPAPEQEPEDALLTSARREELATCIGRLSPLHREALALVFFHGLSYEETAQTLGLPLGTVKSRLANARKALRKLLEASEEER